MRLIERVAVQVEREVGLDGPRAKRRSQCESRPFAGRAHDRA